MYRKAANRTTRSFTRSNCTLETSIRSHRTPGIGSRQETKELSFPNFRVRAMTSLTSSLILVSIVSPKSLNRGIDLVRVLLQKTNEIGIRERKRDYRWLRTTRVPQNR